MRRSLALGLAVAALVAGCGSGSGDSGSGPGGSSSKSNGSESTSPSPTRTALPGGWGPTEQELLDAAERVDAMSTEEKVGSLLMPQFSGRSATQVSAEQAKVNQQSLGTRTAADAIKKYHLGGAIVMGQNITDARQVKSLNDGLAKAGRDGTDLPLLLSVDQEGGIVQRVKAGATTYPPAKTIGSTGKPANARLLAKDNGTELAAMGFTMDFAPIADVGFDSPAIGSRAYADNPDDAAAMASAAVDGYREAGVVPVVKHFPGHGSATADSHQELPEITRSKAQLEATDLPPFERAIADQVPAVLTGHLDVRAIDPGKASSVSKPVVTGLLRDELKFRGVTVTDSAMMEPIAGEYGPGKAAVKAVRAGQDIVLMPENLPKAYGALVRAAESGRLSKKLLDDAATRVTALRLYAKRIGADRPAWGDVPWQRHRADVARVESEAN